MLQLGHYMLKTRPLAKDTMSEGDSTDTGDVPTVKVDTETTDNLQFLCM